MFWDTLHFNIFGGNTNFLNEMQEYSCDSKSVVLRDVHADMSGYYKCEVTSQELYETVEKKDYLLVVRKFDNYNFIKKKGVI